MKPTKFTILLFEDNPEPGASASDWMKWIIEFLEGQEGGRYTVNPLVAETSDKTYEYLSSQDHIDLAIIDLKEAKVWGPTGAEDEQFVGLEIISRIGSDPEFAGKVEKVVAFTGTPPQEKEASVVESGAYDYWHKDVILTPEDLQKRLEELFDLPSRYSLDQFRGFFETDQEYVDANLKFDDIQKLISTELRGNSLAIKKVRWSILQAAILSGGTRRDTEGLDIDCKIDEVPVLITGETGTGKEVVAQLVHSLSRRGLVKNRARPVSIDCGLYVNEDLLRSELFGTHRGAFTNAIEREGILEAHHGTTLFLDEVGNASEVFQQMLLRAIETRRGARLGSAHADEYEIDLRFIAATDAEIYGDESFSKSFLYRIQGLHIHLPPLRERPEDIIPLAVYFLKEGLADADEKPEFSYAAKRALTEYSWPGNVRQLKNTMLIIAQRLKYQAMSLAGRKITIFRSEIDDLLTLHDHVSDENTDGGKDKVHSTVFEFSIGRNASFKNAKERFARGYVQFVHRELNGEDRSKQACERTSRVLGVTSRTIQTYLSGKSQGE